MIKTFFLIFGASGSGKTSLAHSLMLMNPDNFCICEADSYFYDNKGHYNFNPSKLGAAHASCQKRFEDALKADTQLVIVSNTSTTAKERKIYVDKAAEYGYTTHVVLVERHLGTKSVHNVPQETLDRQVANLRNSIQF